MSDTPEFYRTVDPIHDLKLRIRVRRLRKQAVRKRAVAPPILPRRNAAGATEPESNAEQANESQVPPRATSEASSDYGASEYAVTVGWQEKLLTPR